MAVKYNNPLEELMESVKGGMSSLVGNSLMKVFDTARNVVTHKAGSDWTSKKAWLGSEGPNLDLSILFFCYRPSDNILPTIKLIGESVFPKAVGGSVQAPPNRYNPHTKRGILSVEVGQWFKAIETYLITNYTANFSQNVNEANGTPLYCEVKISMEPWKMLNYHEWQSFFLK